VLLIFFRQNHLFRRILQKENRFPFEQGTTKEWNDPHSVKSVSERLIKALSRRKTEKRIFPALSSPLSLAAVAACLGTRDTRRGGRRRNGRAVFLFSLKQEWKDRCIAPVDTPIHAMTPTIPLLFSRRAKHHRVFSVRAISQSSVKKTERVCAREKNVGARRERGGVETVGCVKGKRAGDARPEKTTPFSPLLSPFFLTLNRVI